MTRAMDKARRLVCALVALLSLSIPAFAASVEDYLRPPLFRRATLSPDGTHLAVLMPVNGRMSLATVDLATRNPRVLTSFSRFDVVEYHWVGSERLVFSLGQFDTPIGESFGGGGLFAIRRDGSESRELSATNSLRGFRFFQSIHGSDTEVIAERSERSIASVDLYRLNVVTGNAVLLTSERPRGDTVDWLLDANLVPRVAIAVVDDDATQVAYHRRSVSDPWQELVRFGRGEGRSFRPVWIAADTDELLVLARREGDTTGVYRFDVKDRRLGERVAYHPRYDMTPSSVLVSRDDRTVLGFEVEADRHQVAWSIPELDRIQATVDRALPARVNLLAHRPDLKRTLITSYSDRQPARVYLFDEATRRIEELLASRPWLEPDDLVEMRAFLLATRDGLEIPGYYLLPKDHSPGTRLPTVIIIHGGPEVRTDYWGYSSIGVQQAQLLASRGYAVVLPNFRITPGLGARIHQAGVGQLGRKMQDDHEDATRWAIGQGFADPGRLCVMGGSYGGFAALLEGVRSPSLYKCVIASFAVTDFGDLVGSSSSVYNYSRYTPSYYRRLLGDALSDPAVMKRISPAKNAASIKAAVLLVAGAEDRIAPIEQTRAMQRALERAGNAPRMLVKGNEGHGFRSLSARVEEGETILDFLNTHIGSRQTIR
jgi:dipeptidyl aminopeptidase/acylaminoacyl peptidase